MSEYSKVSSKRYSRKARPVLALLMGTVLVGCAAPGFGPGVSRYEPTYLRLTGEQDFAQALRRHYLELATNAFDRGDAARSDFYSLRALMAAEGKLAHPSAQSGSGEVAVAGARLSQLLMTGARTGSPDLAARAQAAYDCWLIESGSDGDPQIAEACRYNAMNALAELEGASTGAPLHSGTTTNVAPTQTQSYVVQPGGQGQTIHAPGGYTIQIITEQHAPVAAPAPAHFIQTVPHAAPQMIETIPVAQPAPAIEFVEEAPIVQQEFLAPPVIESVPTVAVETIAMAPIVEAVEAAPAIIQSAALPTVNLGPVQAEPILNVAPIETVPVFNTAPVETLPAVEFASTATFDTGEAAQALLDANSNMGGDFSVFFGFDSDEVTIEAEDVLVDAVERIRLSGARRITLIGFTDSMGNARYNQLLAMRRAQAVRQYLQEKLGDAVAFEILPVGEVQAVQTGGDGVKEALNRKVQIALQ